MIETSVFFFFVLLQVEVEVLLTIGNLSQSAIAILFEIFMLKKYMYSLSKGSLLFLCSN